MEGDGHDRRNDCPEIAGQLHMVRRLGERRDIWVVVCLSSISNHSIDRGVNQISGDSLIKDDRR